MNTLAPDLAKSAGDAARAARADRSIRAAAEARRAEIESELADLRPRAVTDPESAERYQALVLERGRLDRVLAG